MSENMEKNGPKQHPGFMKNFTSYCIEYTENTSLHGVKYIGEKKRNISERICWSLVFAISLYICTGLMIKTYRRWESSPVIVSFAEKPLPVWRIPFPAVTICPQTKSRQTIYNFTANYQKFAYTEGNLTDDEIQQFQDVLLVCNFEDTMRRLEHTVNNKSLDFLLRVAPSLNISIFNCEWKKNTEECDNLFSPILTDEGICFTFNILNKNDIYKERTFIDEHFLNHKHDRYGWTLEDGYQKGAEDYFPKRARSAGSEEGLNLLLTANKTDLDYMCKGPVQGFKLLLHQAGEIPRVSSQYIHLPLDHEVVVSVKPEMMTTSNDLRHYEAYRRLCYFSWEKSLRFFKNYTQQNCELECITNYTLIKCDCVAYHMPHDAGTALCGINTTTCQFNARDELISGFIDESSEINCDCLPDCVSLTYNAETSVTTFNWTAVIKAYGGNMSILPDFTLTQLTIFFKERQFLPSCRNELFGMADFMANCGGLFGLFIGFSLLSLVEIMYFMSMRLLCNIRRYGKNYWSGSSDLLCRDDIV